MAGGKKSRYRTYLGLGAAVLACGLLGWRVQGTVREVLGTARRTRVLVDPQVQEERNLLARVARQDSLVAEAIPGERDPFRDPVYWSGTSRSGGDHPAAEPRVVPSFGALLYASENPSVMLRVGSENSAWLHRGESFHGWTVTGISSNSVTITKDSETVVLHSS
jgi:hypothetical protein